MMKTYRGYGENKKRYSASELKELGFTQVRSMNAMTNGHMVVSYGLPVTLGKVTAHGRHDYSQSTGNQVTQATGYNTKERRERYEFISDEFFEEKATNYINKLRSEQNA